MQNFTLQFWKRCVILPVILSCFLFTTAHAQQTITVSGVVTSKEDGTPIPGTTVVVKSTNQGTSADAAGKFTIRAAVGATLVFKVLGFETLEATVKGSTLNVS